MKNSKDELRAAAIIEEVFEKTSEEYLKLRIDEPIEQAASKFEFDREAPVTNEIFNQITSDFVRHIYERGMRCRQELSVTEAGVETVAILEEGYQSSNGRGYYAAFLDASNPQLNGLECVLVQMADLIVMKARAKHIRGVCVSRMELADRPTRCLIAEMLMERWKPFLHQNIRGCSPEQFAYHLSELIYLGISTNRMVSKMLGVNIGF